MDEQKILELGFYSEELLNDQRFNELVQYLVEDLSKAMLASESPEEREGYHGAYIGLRTILETMRQFVLNKDMQKDQADAEQKD